MRVATFLLVAGLASAFPGARADDPAKGWEFVGRTEATATADVRPRVSGAVVRVAVRDGATVAKGDLLVEIDPRAYQLDLDGAKARLRGAETRLESARATAANTRRLVQTKVVGQGELDLNAAAEAGAEAALRAARVDVERAELTLSWTRVTASFAGRVSRVQAAEGGVVAADQAPLLRVAAADPMYVTFNVPEGILLQLRRDGLADPGKLAVAVGFALDNGTPHEAKLDAIEPEVDPRTGTTRFRATVPNPKGLLVPGLSARVRLTAR
jgi:RND family efflux transporter MFP subunit